MRILNKLACILIAVSLIGGAALASGEPILLKAEVDTGFVERGGAVIDGKLYLLESSTKSIHEFTLDGQARMYSLWSLCKSPRMGIPAICW